MTRVRSGHAKLNTTNADPEHLGARIGMTAVLHSWGSALTHHPHVHMIVPGGGLSLDGERSVPCRGRFFLPVGVLSRLFRRLFLERLAAVYEQGRMILEGGLAKLASPAAFAALLKPLRRKNWFVYAKRPFAGPKAVLAYLSRYTHRVAISNTRLLAHDERGVTFRYKDYRGTASGPAQGDDAGGGRVHPPLYAAHPAEGLSPHPSLRVVRQHGPRQYRTAARTAGLCASCRDKRNSQSKRASRDSSSAMSVLRRTYDRYRVLRARNAAAIPPAFRGYHPDRHIMSWNALLEHTMPPRFAGRPQAAKPTLCLRWPTNTNITPKMLPVAAASQVNPATIPCIRLAAFPKTRAPLTNAGPVSLKSP